MNTLERLTLAAYSGFAWMLQPLVHVKLWRRARDEPEYGLRIKARYGYYGDKVDAGRVWVHAVSMGETRAAAVLIAQLRAQRPGVQILLTHGTASGWIAGGAILQPGDQQEWFPWDTPGATERFVRHFRPSIGLMMETEVWPNMVQTCARHKLPLLLVNARKSEHSFANARSRRWLAGPAYRGLTAVLAQSSADAQRLTALGARVVAETGNIKFDARPAPDQLELGAAWRHSTGRPVLMLASSREGEESKLLEALASRRGSGAGAHGVQILVVPRHTQRSKYLADMFRAAGYTVSLRSQWGGQPVQADIWLGDSMGELALYYALSDVALLGGSFTRFGGQNLIEAAAAGCPVVMGPHTYNFSDAANWALAAGAARRAGNMDDAVNQAFDCLGRPDELRQTRQTCLAFAAAHHGAASRSAQLVLELAESMADASGGRRPFKAPARDRDRTLDPRQGADMPLSRRAGMS